ncbi:MAG: hypothetical protein AB8B79_03600 [Granulosicoccus sp.]
MFIPMGTVVTVCMLATVIFAIRHPAGGLNRRTPEPLLRLIGVITGAAGLWNVLWYGLRHFSEFWGLMALGSGATMCLLSYLMILPPNRQPAILNSLRTPAVLVLLGFAAKYAWTIYKL